MYIKHFFLRHILENVYFLISFTGLFKTSIGIKFYQYLYKKYKLISEREEISQLTSFIKVGSLAIDVGANIGIYSEIFSNAVGHKGKVIAIEPNPINLQALTRKFPSSKSNVSIIEAAASNKDEKLFLNKSRLSPASSHISNKNKGLAIQGITLDQVTLNSKIPISIIKIDVEGAEGLVIDGGKKTINKYRPVISMEYTPDRLYDYGTDPIDLLSFLKKNEYSFYLLGNKDKDKEEMLTIDSIFKYSKAQFTIDLLCLPKEKDFEIAK